MFSKDFKINFNFYFNLIVLFILFFIGLVWADSNGIWYVAEDVRGGVVGSDEQANTTYFGFINPVFINSNLTVNGYIETYYPISPNHIATKKYVDDKKTEIFSCYKKGLLYNGSSCICVAGGSC